MIEEISSIQNPKVKSALSLIDRRDRDKTKLFLIEGFRELSRAALGHVEIVQVFFCEALFLGSNEQTLLKLLAEQGAVLQPCTERVFRKISYRDRPDGLVAVARHMDTNFSRFFTAYKGENPFFLVAESIEKPGNLGTILRSCDAVGVDGVVICDKCTDLFNPNVVRASVGTLFTQPVLEATGAEVVQAFKKKGIRIVSATPQASEEFTQVDLTGPVAIIVGTEQLGLSPLWMEAADICVKIPMKGEADSLNVATATTLLLYEVLRQRNVRGMA